MNISKELKIWKVSIFWENLSIDLSEPPISTTLLVYAELLIHEGLIHLYYAIGLQFRHQSACNLAEAKFTAIMSKNSPELN